MKKNLVILFVSLIIGLLHAADPVVENVRLEQRTDGSLYADIYYDVTDADGDTLTITLQASDDDGATWELPVNHVSGDIGDSVLTGTGKHIVWDFLADNPGISGEGYQVRIIAIDFKEPAMVFVKGGTFDMGSTDGEDDEQPVHSVTLNDFYMDLYEVTKGQYTDFLNAVLANGSITVTEDVVKQDTTTLLDLSDEDCKITYSNGVFAVTDNKEEHPVTNVTWFGADAYAKYFNKRLPTEAEWEYAARGGSESQGYTYSGGNDMDAVGWFNTNADSTQAVGMKKANELGLYDMSGNVWEWCADRYDRDYYYTGPGSNPYGPYDENKTARVLRGGAWDDVQAKAKTANRNRDHAWTGYNNRGFRCVKGDTAFTKLDSINISPQDKTIKKGEFLPLNCTAWYSDGSKVDISMYATWELLSGTSGSIDSKGLFTASDDKGGNVKIQALFDGLTVETTVTVDFGHETGYMSDIDRNTYKIVKIGSQWWMAENLKVTHYSNGDEIYNFNYDNDENNLDIYGAMYRWYALVYEQNIAPEGWHVPTDDEWKQLESYLGVSDLDNVGQRGTVEGGMLKETGTNHWNSPNTGATNESGFGALPGGFRHYTTGEFQTINTNTCFWTSSQNDADNAWARSLGYDHSTISRDSYNKGYGFYVRLVRDSDVKDADFTLTFPNGGESIIAGHTISIRWDAGPYDEMVTLDLCQNGIALIRIAETENDGEFSWEIPNTLTTSNYTIKITGTQSSMSDISDKSFEIQFDEASFEMGTVTDIDGNVYKTIKIGEQWWMMEDLRVTHYRNGDPIPNVTDGTEWSELETGAFCYYNNDSNYADDYGAMYNGYAADAVRNIAPEGWHVPTDDEWKQLELYLGMSQEEADSEYGYRGTNEGGKLKEIGFEHWKSPNTGATNESGFTARSGGCRSFFDGDFHEMGVRSYYWSAPEVNKSSVLHRRLSYYSETIYRDSSSKQSGCSIRLIRDNDKTNIPPIITFPNGGEYLKAGVEYFIKWNNNPIDERVYIDLYKGDELVERIVDMDTTHDSEYTWRISPNLISGTDYRIKITGVVTGLYDISDDYFSIVNDGLDFETGTMTDIDGNVYKTVKIGNQWWMAENLKVTHYRDGTPIQHVTQNSVWKNKDTGAYCYYDNDSSNASVFGALYNGYVIDHLPSIAPEGWHVPTDDEWKELELYLGMSQEKVESYSRSDTDEGAMLKERGTIQAGTGFWREPNTGATNEYGFSARPGGQREIHSGEFEDLYNSAYFWVDQPNDGKYHNGFIQRQLIYDEKIIDWNCYISEHGYSIRLIRDNSELNAPQTVTFPDED